METYYDGFGTCLELYSKIDSPLLVNENVCSNGDYEILRLMNEVDFEIPPYSSVETSLYSSSSEEVNSVEGFCHQSVNSSAPCHSVRAQSAFRAYIKADPIANAAVDSFKTGQILQKRCFNLLRRIEKKRKLARQRSILTAPAPAPAPAPAAAPAPATAGKNDEDQNSQAAFRNKSAIQHMIAERNRRINLKKHFSNIHSLLPRNSKKDKHSILANTTHYLTQLKHRVAELEQQNQNLLESIPTNISNKEQGSSGLESYEQSFNSESILIYRSDGVTLEQCLDIPNQVNIRMDVQTNLVSCTTDLIIKLLDRLRVEQLEVLSIQSHSETFRLHANILVRSQGQVWDISKWQNFGSVLRTSLV